MKLPRFVRVKYSKRAQADSFYWTPCCNGSPIEGLPLRAQPLGTDRRLAIAKAAELNAQYDAWRESRHG